MRWLIGFAIALAPACGRTRAPAAPAGPVTPRAPVAAAEPATVEPAAPVLGDRMNAVVDIYDRGDFEGAVAAAEAVLADAPDNTRMLRILVSSHCLLGDSKRAHAAWARLPEQDQQQMTRRCARYGITFP